MAYVDVSELQRVTQKVAPTQAELEALQRVVDVAAQEIDWDLSYTADNPAPVDDPLLADVNLDRAAELWTLNFSRGAGLIAGGPVETPIVSPRDTWYRHHLRLNPLRTTFAVG
jgi:hypothetical protein